jgi:hypothetical protein
MRENSSTGDEFSRATICEFWLLIEEYKEVKQISEELEQ